MSDIKKITDVEYKMVISLYPIWKELNSSIKNIYSRGVNFHEVFSEFIVCYINDYYHSLGSGSEDAYTSDMKKKVQVKASSNFNSDLTSFGPTSEFDILEFARLNQEENKLYLYKIPIDNLYDINVNSNETFKEQQQSGRRPRFSIIEKYIKEYNLKHYAVVDMITGLYF